MLYIGQSKAFNCFVFCVSDHVQFWAPQRHALAGVCPEKGQKDDEGNGALRL